MPTSQTPKMPISSIDQSISEKEFAYAKRRYENQLYRAIVNAFAQEAKAGRISRASLAKRIGKKPEQITRWLSAPSNMTASTTSRILFGMDAELKEPEVVFFRDSIKPNYAHPLIDFLAGASFETGEDVRTVTLGDISSGEMHATQTSTNLKSYVSIMGGTFAQESRGKREH